MPAQSGAIISVEKRVWPPAGSALSITNTAGQRSESGPSGWAMKRRRLAVEPKRRSCSDLTRSPDDGGAHPELWFAAGQVLEQQGQFDRAFEAFAEGNRRKRLTLTDPEKSRRTGDGGAGGPSPPHAAPRYRPGQYRGGPRAAKHLHAGLHRAPPGPRPSERRAHLRDRDAALGLDPESSRFWPATRRCRGWGRRPL